MTLKITREEGEFYEIMHGGYKEMARWFHLRVTNQADDIAQNCTVFLEKVFSFKTKEDISSLYPPVEYKWRGVTIPSVSIPAGKSRDFDAFYVLNSNPTMAILGYNGYITDSDELKKPLGGPGRYELVYSVYSSNYAPASATLILKLSPKLESVDFYQIE